MFRRRGVGLGQKTRRAVGDRGLDWTLTVAHREPARHAFWPTNLSGIESPFAPMIGLGLSGASPHQRRMPNAKRILGTDVPALHPRLVQQPAAHLHAGSWKAAPVSAKIVLM